MSSASALQAQAMLKINVGSWAIASHDIAAEKLLMRSRRNFLLLFTIDFSSLPSVSLPQSREIMFPNDRIALGYAEHVNYYSMLLLIIHRKNGKKKNSLNVMRMAALTTVKFSPQTNCKLLEISSQLHRKKVPFSDYETSQASNEKKTETKHCQRHGNGINYETWHNVCCANSSASKGSLLYLGAHFKTRLRVEKVRVKISFWERPNRFRY